MAYRPSYVQIESLVDFLEDHPGIAKGLLKSNNGRAETKKKWAEIATSLNALGGANKDGQGWAKYWSEKKCALKKQCAQRSASLRRTGGGPDDSPHTFSPLELRMVEIMGGAQFATGDPQFAVNPFPRIRNQPVNDQNDSVIPEAEIIIEQNLADVEEDSLFQSPPGPLPGTSDNQQVLQTPRSRSRSNLRNVGPHRRRPIRRRTALANAEADMERLARIEERRVDAEAITAQAFADLATTLSANTAALESIAGALTCIANAIGRFCTNSRPPPHSHDYL